LERVFFVESSEDVEVAAFDAAAADDDDDDNEGDDEEEEEEEEEDDGIAVDCLGDDGSFADAGIWVEITVITIQ
jgi:hypothetical protein